MQHRKKYEKNCDCFFIPFHPKPLFINCSVWFFTELPSKNKHLSEKSTPSLQNYTKICPQKTALSDPLDLLFLSFQDFLQKKAPDDQRIIRC
jgi:hypothetical protein